MGMYDNIDYTMKCPLCGHFMLGFQSKDKDCTLSKLEFWQVDNFYTHCDNCEAWIEFNLKDEARKKLKIEDYEMKFEGVESQKN